MKTNSKVKENSQAVPPVKLPKLSRQQLLQALMHDMKTCSSLCMFITQNHTVQDAIVDEMLRIQENRPQTFDEANVWKKDEMKVKQP